MNAVIMDRVVLGEESIVGALTFIKEGTIVPPRSLVVGNPGKIIKQVSDEMIVWKTKGTQIYRDLAGEMLRDWEVCEAITEKMNQNQVPTVNEYVDWGNTSGKV
jgi:carbonic anhydrase/acetyltransferase-like protein (isoleucine patch superfamily)